MASYCPHCNYKLSIIDIKPECPVCGVNLMFYGMEERLKEEADKAEFEHAMTQPHIDRLKAATVGSPIAITRLVLTVLALAASLVPFAQVTMTLPYCTRVDNVGLINVITDVYMDLDFDYYFAMFNDNMLGKGNLFEFISLILFTLCLVTALVNLFNLLFAGGPRGIRRNVTMASLGLVFAAGAAVTYGISVAAFNDAIPELYSGKLLPWGIIAVAGTLIAVIVINLIYKKKAPPVKYKDVSKFLVGFDEREPEPEEETADADKKD